MLINQRMEQIGTVLTALIYDRYASYARDEIQRLEREYRNLLPNDLNPEDYQKITETAFLTGTDIENAFLDYLKPRFKAIAKTMPPVRETEPILPNSKLTPGDRLRAYEEET